MSLYCFFLENDKNSVIFAKNFLPDMDLVKYFLRARLAGSTTFSTSGLGCVLDMPGVSSGVWGCQVVSGGCFRHFFRSGHFRPPPPGHTGIQDRVNYMNHFVVNL